MTTNECKKDLAQRLTKAGVTYTKLTAKTVSFEGLGYGKCIFVKIWAPHWTDMTANLGQFKKNFCADIPKPSAGGYAIETNEGGFC